MFIINMELECVLHKYWFTNFVVAKIGCSIMTMAKRRDGVIERQRDSKVIIFTHSGVFHKKIFGRIIYETQYAVGTGRHENI